MTSRRHVYRALMALGVLGCAAAVQRPDGGIDATLTRGGGIAGLSETVHVWSVGDESQGIYARSDRAGSQPVQLPKQTLDSSLAVLESLIASVPRLPADTG